MDSEVETGERPIQYSAVVPVYNEEESLEKMLSELVQALSGMKKPYELIFVDDKSDDRSPDILKEFTDNLPGVVRVITLDQRSGQTAAMRKGLDAVRGDIVFTLDADLQNDPADFPKLVDQMQEGSYDCVCGWRKARSDKFLKAVLSKTGNVLQRICTGLKVHDVSCTLRAYKRHCIGDVTLNWEGQHRFIPLSLSLQGYKVGEIQSNHRLREFGTTKYSHKRIFKVVQDFFVIVKSRGKG